MKTYSQHSNFHHSHRNICQKRNMKQHLSFLFPNELLPFSFITARNSAYSAFVLQFGVFIYYRLCSLGPLYMLTTGNTINILKMYLFIPGIISRLCINYNKQPKDERKTKKYHSTFLYKFFKISLHTIMPSILQIIPDIY